MSFKRILALLFWAFALFFITQAPSEAGRLVQVTGQTAADWFGAIARIVVDVLNGVFP